MKLNERMAKVEPLLRNWWELGDQKEPLIVASYSTEKEIDEGVVDLKSFFEDTDATIKRNVERINKTKYFGVAVPYHYLDFGSSAMAGVLGAKMEYVDTQTIWAHPIYNTLEEVENITLDKDNFFYKKIYDLAEKSAKQSHNHYFIAPYALGGIGDTLSSLYGTENLLLDFYDKPELVKKVMSQIKEIWLNEFKSIQHVIAKGQNNGGIGWAGIWAPGSTFPVQEDMSYMISTEMFKKFCLEHIVDMIEAMEYPFYHLDGTGQVPHLKYLLQIPRLKVIQWQPGAGKEELKQWYELIKKIIDSGKSVQLFAKAYEVEDAVKQIGSKGVLFVITDANEQNINMLSKKYKNVMEIFK